MFVAFELAFEADDSGADGAEVRIASGLAWLGKFEAGDFAAQLEGMSRPESHSGRVSSFPGWVYRSDIEAA